MLDPRSILEALPVGVWVAQVPSGQVVYANPEFRNIMGMDAVEESRIRDAPATYGIFDLEGRPYPVDRLPFSQVVMTGRAVTVDDLVIQRADGRNVNVRAFAYPLFANGGDLTHVLVAFIDITAEMTAEAQRRQTESRLAFAVNHAPIAIWAADAMGVVTLSEGAGLASLGVKSGELVGQNLFDLYKDHPSIPGFLRRALAGESFWYTVQVGDAVYETWVNPLTDVSGRVTGVVGRVQRRHRPAKVSGECHSERPRHRAGNPRSQRRPRDQQPSDIHARSPRLSGRVAESTGVGNARAGRAESAVTSGT